MYPILFSIGRITVYTYGLMMALAFLAAIWIISYSSKEEGLDIAKLVDLAFFAILSGIIGSRIFYILINPLEYISHPLKIFKIWEGGLVFYGGILGGILATIYLIKRYQLPLWKTLDILAPALILAQAIGRIGCFMAGCCYGQPTELPWSVTFNNPKTLAPMGIPIHPTQLYHSSVNLIIFAILFFIVRKRRHFTGQIFSLYLCLYSAGRFVIEFFRGGAKIRLTAGLNLPQLISVVIFLSGVFLYWRLKTMRL